MNRLLLYLIFGLLAVALWVYLDLEASDKIAIIALCVAVVGAVSNYFFTLRTFKATNFPVPLIRPIPPDNRDIINFSLVNHHKSIPIKEAKLLVEMRYSRNISNLLRYARWKKICEGSTKLILPEARKVAGKTENLVEIINQHYPHVLQSYTLNNDEVIKVTGEYVFDLKFRIKYIPLISGGKEQTVTYPCTLIPETTSENILESWKFDMVQYPPPEDTATKFG